MKNSKIAVIGLGYVGLPFALESEKQFKVLGFDINQDRIEERSRGAQHRGKGGANTVIFDTKAFLNRDIIDARL